MRARARACGCCRAVRSLRVALLCVRWLCVADVSVACSADGMCQLVDIRKEPKDATVWKVRSAVHSGPPQRWLATTRNAFVKSVLTPAWSTAHHRPRITRRTSDLPVHARASRRAAPPPTPGGADRTSLGRSAVREGGAHQRGERGTAAVARCMPSWYWRAACCMYPAICCTLYICCLLQCCMLFAAGQMLRVACTTGSVGARRCDQLRPLLAARA